MVGAKPIVNVRLKYIRLKIELSATRLTVNSTEYAFWVCVLIRRDNEESQICDYKKSETTYIHICDVYYYLMRNDALDIDAIEKLRRKHEDSY